MKALKNKGVDLVAGSEKILRVHHRNMVHARYLQKSLDSLDVVCKRNLNRVQQEIYNVYYSELLPLQESKKNMDAKDRTVRKGNKKFGLAGDGRVKQKCVFPDLSRSSNSICRSWSTMSVFSKISDDVISLPQIGNKPRKMNISENRTLVPLSTILKLPRDNRSRMVKQWKEDFERSCPSVVSRHENITSPEIDFDRLQTIKSAIAISSQPPLFDQLKKHRKLRKSFLVNLRRESKPTWSDSAWKGKHEIVKQNSVLSRNNSAKSTGKNMAAQTKGNSMMNDNGNFDQMPTASKSTIALFKENTKDDSLLFSDDGSYYSTTPELFSEIDEEHSSFEDSDSDGYSYTSGTGSSYSEYSEDEFSATDDEQ